MLATKKTWIVHILQFAICASILSQVYITSSLLRNIMYTTWLFLTGFCIVKNRGRILISPFIKHYLVSLLLYLLFCFIFSLMGFSHLSGRYLKILGVPLLISFVGYCLAEDISIDALLIIAKTYIVASFFFALWVHVTYFSSYSAWLGQMTYLFPQKNSAAQIWCSSILLEILFLRANSKKLGVMWSVIAVYLLIITALCQCRTALLAMGTILVVYVVAKSQKKMLCILIIGIMVATAWNIPYTKEFIEKSFVLYKYESADINTFSSGRIDLYALAINAFFQSPLIGNGVWYVDNSYLSILAESGIIGFLLIESVWVHRIRNNIMGKLRENNLKYKNLFLMMTLFYFIESLFEGFPPFGPGVSCFMFWLLGGLLDNYSGASILLTSDHVSVIPAKVGVKC